MSFKEKNMALRTCAALTLLLLAFPFMAEASDPDPEWSESKSSTFLDAFGLHEPMFFALGQGKPAGATEDLDYAKFQVSFLFEMIRLNSRTRPEDPRRGLFLGYTQTSYWDLESRSQPFFDTSFKPGFFGLYQWLGGRDLGWIERIDVEGGYQHHSNGKGLPDSRYIDVLYIQPTFVWQAGSAHRFFVTPRAWTYLTKSVLNEDIADYWGYLDLELTWRAAFGLQIETHVIPAKNETTFGMQATYPLNRLWSPLNFYALVDYRDGAGETILQYNERGSGWLFGIALTR